MAGIAELHERASELMQRTLLDVRPEQLSAATPCSGWNLGDLLAHQLGQEHGFAQGLSAGGEQLDDWVPLGSGEQAAEVLTQALRRTDAALSEFPDVDGGEIWMPEIRASAALPAGIAIRAHLLDLVVHSWDIGAAIGHPPVPDAELASFVLAEAERIPTDGPTRSGPFTDVVAEGEAGTSAADPFAAALRLCGRRPDWTPPA